MSNTTRSKVWNAFRHPKGTKQALIRGVSRKKVQDVRDDNYVSTIRSNWEVKHSWD